jgi:hypothetical protein
VLWSELFELLCQQGSAVSISDLRECAVDSTRALARSAEKARQSSTGVSTQAPAPAWHAECAAAEAAARCVELELCTGHVEHAMTQLRALCEWHSCPRESCVLLGSAPTPTAYRSAHDVPLRALHRCTSMRSLSMRRPRHRTGCMHAGTFAHRFRWFRAYFESEAELIGARGALGFTTWVDRQTLQWLPAELAAPASDSEPEEPTSVAVTELDVRRCSMVRMCDIGQSHSRNALVPHMPQLGQVQ